MVHALEQIHSLLKSDGYLINIQPNGEKGEIIGRFDGGDHFIGHYEETDDYIEYFQAAEALQSAVAAGMFQVNEMGTFEFCNHTDSFDELHAFLAESWSDALITDEVIASAKSLEKSRGTYETILLEHVRISLLQAVQ